MEKRQELRENVTGYRPTNAISINTNIRKQLCGDCPLRNSTERIQEQALEMFERINDDENVLIEDIEEFAEVSKNNNPIDGLAKCAMRIVEAKCDLYKENQEYGSYVERVQK